MAAPKIYEVDLPEGVTPAEGLDQARAKARGAGIRIEGDESGGTFGGTAEGRYTVSERRLRLEVRKKPAFVPWSLVEKGLRQVFGDVRTVA